MFGDHSVENRRLQREQVLCFLYEAWAKDVAVDEVVKNLEIEPQGFVLDAVSGIAKHQEKIDKIINEKLTNWKIERIPIINLLILRFGIWEILYYDETPKPVAISEAVELVKSYSVDDSWKFVNGVLDSFN